MPSGKIYGFGEIVYDIIFKNHQIIHSLPGGSVLNALMNAAYAGVTVEMVAEISTDQLGKEIRAKLIRQGVGTSFLFESDRESRLALAFLNRSNDATYNFYGSRSGFPAENFGVPHFQPGDIFLFGSTAAALNSSRNYLKSVLKITDKKNVLVYYDPNVRIGAAGEQNYFRNILENIASSDIVRGSIDDFEAIFRTKNPKQIWKEVSAMGVQLLMITNGKKDLALFTENLELTIPAKRLKTVTTVGAGDAFNAGFITYLIQNGITKQKIQDVTQNQWKECVKKGIDSASNVCLLLSNYPEK